MSKRRQLENNPKVMTTPSTKMGQPQNKNNSKLHTHSHTIFHIALFFLYDKTLKIGNVNQNSRSPLFFKTFLLTSQMFLPSL